MNELGVVMNIRELGVTKELLEGLVQSPLVMEGGYKAPTPGDILLIFKKSKK